MTIDISYESKINLDIPYEKIIEETLLGGLDFELCPYECEISVTIVDDEDIRLINKEYRGLDKSTDVLSFPFNKFSAAANFDGLEEDMTAFNPETGELLLGDIIISAEHILSQAKDYAHSAERELAFLAVHSLLHLLGYDHIEEKDRELMESRQKAILDKGGYKR